MSTIHHYWSVNLCHTSSLTINRKCNAPDGEKKPAAKKRRIGYVGGDGGGGSSDEDEIGDSRVAVAGRKGAHTL